MRFRTLTPLFVAAFGLMVSAGCDGDDTVDTTTPPTPNPTIDRPTPGPTSPDTDVNRTAPAPTTTRPAGGN